MSSHQVYDSVSSCSLRYNVTSEPWLVPFRSLDGANKDVKLVDIREPPFVHTHELVPNFQVCGGGSWGQVKEKASCGVHDTFGSKREWVWNRTLVFFYIEICHNASSHHDPNLFPNNVS